jgi:hypothetical protein
VTLRERLTRLDRVQQGLTFKIAASVVVVVAALALVISYGIAASQGPAPDLSAFSASQPAPGGVQSDMDATKAVIQDILAARTDTGSFALSVSLGAALALGVIWLGLGLTILAIALGVGGVVALAMLTPAGRSYAPPFVGVLLLTGALAVLLRGVMQLLGGSNPVLAIARNVIAEGVRMKLTLVPIVFLILGLAALPSLLEPDQPLRYRVQSFLQFGTGTAFWLIAALTVVFSVATVAFDQRDKTIWQTITKPVACWQYLLGKWLGVATLGAVLLAVAGAGVFMFVEHLRTQPARGETRAYVSDDGPISDDRLVLESQVLTARRSVQISPAPYDREQFIANVLARAEEEFAARRAAGETPEHQEYQRSVLINEITRSIDKSVQIAYRTIPAGQSQRYVFEGLGAARGTQRPVILRFKINAGGNAPDALYRISLRFQGADPTVREVVLSQWQTIPLVPGVISEDGVIEMEVLNGDFQRGTTNPESITFPPDGLEISFTAGSYRANFFRVVSILWVKLAFLSMLGVCLGTFLSFPVAILVGMTIFFAAEGAGFLKEAMENFWTTDHQGHTLYLNSIIEPIASAIAWIFHVYADLRPTGRLVEGIRLSWGDVATGTATLALWTTVLFLAGVLILRRRELAIYSGQ